MKVWQRRTIGLLAICGSTIAIVASPGSLQNAHGPILALLLFALAVYVFGICCGVVLLEGTPRSVKMNRVFWAFQIPVLKSPYLGYALASGAYWQVYAQLGPFDLTTQWYLGTDYSLHLSRPGTPWLVGVNLIAVAIFVFLGRTPSRVPSNNSLKLTADDVPPTSNPSGSAAA